MSALTIQDLSCFYQKNQVLDSLDFELEKDQIICLLGESGCGKTTLLKAIAGLQKHLKGHISINKRDVYHETVNLPAEARKVGFIFQDYALFPHLNVFDNIAFSLYKKNKHEQKLQVNELLKLVQLAGYGSRYPHQLSGGQQQRVAIARALAYQPDLMLLDEPFSNLDHHVRFQLIDEIRLLFKEQKMSALFVTHSKEEGFAFADKIALMQAGKIVQIGEPAALYNYPISKYVADFMGRSNYLEITPLDKGLYQSDFGLLNCNNEVGSIAGQCCSLLLRPEQIIMDVSDNGVGIVKKVDFLGSFQYMTVTYLQHDYCIKQTSQSLIKVGDRVELSILDHDFVIFQESK